MPGLRAMPRNTSAASAICGTHFGLTNADTSITGKFAALSRLTNSILSGVDTIALSFCKPSRGPTSTTVIRVPVRFMTWNSTSGVSACTSSPPFHGPRTTTASPGAPDRQLHLHRFEQHQHLTLQ